MISNDIYSTLQLKRQLLAASLGFTILLSIFAFDMGSQLWAPLFGWDFLQFWGVEVIRALDCSPDLNSCIYEHRHPQTLINLMKTMIERGAVLIATDSIKVLWAAFYITLATVILTALIASSPKPFIGCFFGVCILSSPLLQEHWLIPGYAELPMTLFFTIAVLAPIVVHEKLDRPVFAWVCFVTAIVGMLILKNSGPVYAAICCVSALLSSRAVAELNICAVALVMLALIASAIYVWNAGFFTETLRYKLAFNPDLKLLHFAGWNFTIYVDNFAKIGDVLLYSFLMNASFSTIPLLILLALALTVKEFRRVFGAERKVVEPVTFATKYFLILVLLAAVVTVADLSTDYGLSVSEPGHDTGFSRHLLPIMIGLSAAAAVKIISNIAVYDRW